MGVSRAPSGCSGLPEGELNHEKGHRQAELRLMRHYGLENGPGLFETDTDYLAKAYSKHEMMIAYRRTMADVPE